MDNDVEVIFEVVKKAQFK